MDKRGILSSEPNFDQRFIPDYQELRRWCESFRTQGQTIILTSGSFDLIHIGHARYLDAARRQGDVLVVGVDSDAKIAMRKGEGRPVVPQDERLEMLAHLRAVDIVTIKDLDHEHWQLMDTVRPDILIATAATYSDEQQVELSARFGCKVVVLDRMAITSTSERVRKQQLTLADRVSLAMKSQLPDFIDAVVHEVVDGPAS